MRFYRLLYGVFFVCILAACHTAYQPVSVQHSGYRIQQAATDSSMAKLLSPYADSVNKNMSDIVGIAAIDLSKKQPEGTLNNLLADAMLAEAGRLYKTKVDAAFINYGGIRLPSLPAGTITRGKVYELAPFDNIVVLQKINGTTLIDFLNHVAAKGGWPCAGIQFQIKNKKAVNIIIGGQPLDETAVYTIANNDYVANGGDDCVMLKSIPQQNIGCLFREMVLHHFLTEYGQGRKLTGAIDKRVSNAE